MVATSWTPEPDELDRILDRFVGRHVVVLGDVMLDRYLWGAVRRISPEAPVPVVEVDRESVRLGGAANVAANVEALGARASLLGVVGEDAGAAELRAAMRAAAIEDRWLVADRSRPTTLKTRVVAHHQQVVRVDQEAVADIGSEVAGGLLAQLESRLADAGALVISDYGKGAITGPLLVEVLARCAAAGVPVCVDPKESHFDSYRPVSVLTPNLLEAGNAMGHRVTDQASLETVGFGLLERLGAPAVLVTRGERGMSLFEPGGRHTHFPAVAQEVYDVTGAGDTVVSAYAVALAAGASHRLAAAISNHAASRVILEIGTATTTIEAIRGSIRAPAVPADRSAHDAAHR
jgi:D-beta-D-heptose 7-phosphate kinase/D-beta-D-heptose 1-phosphate adenosyltransferase